jgi:hypothetical protein
VYARDVGYICDDGEEQYITHSSPYVEGGVGEGEGMTINTLTPIYKQYSSLRM